MSSTHAPNTSDQMLVRLEKRANLIEMGHNPYPVNFAETVDSIAKIRMDYSDLEADTKTEDTVTIAGRLMSIRNAGRISFAVIQSGRGDQMQLLISRAEIGDESHLVWRQKVDLGDHVAVTGLVSTSKTGELSIFVVTWAVISKAIRPLPNQHSDLNDETRARQRYLDLILSGEARNQAILRSKVISRIRRMFEENDYLEVETPILQTLHGGASARPFVTHSNAIDDNLYLRIAPELFLKRAVVGGLDRVFEINKNFRNEGMDSTHSPEFTMLEAYEVYSDYNRMADRIEAVIKESAHDVGRYVTDEVLVEVKRNLGSLNEPWQRISLYESLSEVSGIEITPLTPLSEIVSLAELRNIKIQAPTRGKLVEELWESYVKPTLTLPTFVFDYPVDSSPLVADHRSIAGVVEKWDLYIAGMEVATGYSELIDPVVQRARLVEQARFAGRGDDEAMALDEAFLQALEYGMPPTGGIGMGIDRLIMVLSNKGIRDTVLFPLVK